MEKTQFFEISLFVLNWALFLIGICYFLKRNLLTIEYFHRKKNKLIRNITLNTIIDLCLINYYRKRRNKSSSFSINSEADASELPENWENMFSRYYLHNDIFSNLKAPRQCVVRRDGVKNKKNTIFTNTTQIYYTCIQGVYIIDYV